MREERVYFNSSYHPFDIEVAGFSYCDESYLINRPKSAVTCIEYIIDGKGYINFDGKQYTACKGDVYILNTGHDQFYYSDKEWPWKKMWVNVRGDYVTQILNYYKIGNIYVFKDCAVQNLFDEMLEVATSKMPQEDIKDECNIIFMKIVQYLARKYTLHTNKTSIANKLKDLIDSDINFKKSLDDYSKLIYSTKQYAISEFNKEYGITPYQYIISRKVLAAENLLANSNLPIAHIAELLSFEDAHYFSYFFKKHKSISPKQYRNTQKNSNSKEYRVHCKTNCNLSGSSPRNLTVK